MAELECRIASDAFHAMRHATQMQWLSFRCPTSTVAQGGKGNRTMLPIIRIIVAGAILTGWSHVAPVRATHVAPIEPSRQVVDAALAAENCCPLRAWPYIG